MNSKFKNKPKILGLDISTKTALELNYNPILAPHLHNKDLGIEFFMI